MVFKHFKLTGENTFVVLERWLGSEMQDSHNIMKPLSSKLTPTVIDTIKVIFTQEHTLEYEIMLTPTILWSLFLLLKKVGEL